MDDRCMMEMVEYVLDHYRRVHSDASLGTDEVCPAFKECPFSLDKICSQAPISVRDIMECFKENLDKPGTCIHLYTLIHITFNCYINFYRQDKIHQIEPLIELIQVHCPSQKFLLISCDGNRKRRPCTVY